ncbi:cytochrome c' [Amylibacter ulvae]|uniref:Cytochrome c n=1 Tax=Paramylibacter ulvae TaxID=1651968 RepID=A0ABQ3CXW1_9RHOB|nr:cytochrome c [Amylibacter ulvae]GHA49008.1 cytochrome c' [Amylibacter ulvae]
MKPIYAFFAVFALGASAFAHGNATGAVLERMEGMKSIQAAMKVLGKQANSNDTFDRDLVSAAANDIAVHAHNIPALFAEKDMSMPTEAKAEIWDDMDAFNTLAHDLESAAMAAATVQNGDDLKSAMAAIGASCKACHSQYRIKN